jgi:hypothetical protein
MSVKISAMTPADPLDGSELVPILQVGANKAAFAAAFSAVHRFAQVNLVDVTVTGTISPTSIIVGGAIAIPANTLVVGDRLKLFASGLYSMLAVDSFYFEFTSVEAGTIAAGNVFQGQTVADLAWVMIGMLTVRPSGLAVFGGSFLGEQDAHGSVVSAAPFPLTLASDFVLDFLITLSSVLVTEAFTATQLEIVL